MTLLPCRRTPRPSPRDRLRLRGEVALAVGGAGLALIAAGCGSTHAATASSRPPRGGSSASAAVRARIDGRLGRILVDGHGRTLYLFAKDTGPHSTCSGACAAVWPPYTISGRPTAGTGLSASALTTTHRGDGSTEVVYHGHPLYYYAADGRRPGAATGEGLDQFGARWYVVSPAGNRVTGSGSSGTSSSSGGSSSQY